MKAKMRDLSEKFFLTSRGSCGSLGGVTPEKLHLALNHFVFLLPLAALLPLIVGLATRSRAALLSGAGIALLGSLMTGVVMGTGEEAYERYKEGPIAGYLDSGAPEELEHHEELAHDLSKVLYLLAVVSFTTLAIGFFKRAWLRPASFALLGLCIVSVVVGVAIADSGGKIRRPDFRTSNTHSDSTHPHDEADD